MRRSSTSGKAPRKSAARRISYQQLALGISMSGAVEGVEFSMERCWKRPFLLRTLGVPSIVGRCYDVTSIRVGGQELLREPTSAAIFELSVDMPPWMVRVDPGVAVVVSAVRRRGRLPFVGELDVMEEI